MADAQSPDIEDLSRRIAQGQRKAVMRTVGISVVIVVVAAVVLLYTLREIESANRKLAAANAELEQVSTHIAEANDARMKAEADLKVALAQSTALKSEVNDLSRQLDDAKKTLAEALDLGKYVYKLNWNEVKMMATTNGAAAEVLNVINELKDATKWGMSNTPDMGYNSPGFAALVLSRLGRMPADGSLNSLPHDNGAPNVGDIVTYDGGYHMFYFKDSEQREFVVGMTPFGVEALTYDFARRGDVLHTGFPAP